MWIQKILNLPAKQRGFHLVTNDVITQIPELQYYKVGMLSCFLQHTSASLTINENADPTVRQDFEAYLNRTVPEDEPYYKHTYEGSDDLPAHLKSSLLGCSVSIPVIEGKLGLGLWQGIYLGEHRDFGGQRRIVLTLNGEKYE